MDDSKAIEIIKKLADGLDPFTGEIFPPDSPYQNADVTRSLHKAIGVMEKSLIKLERKRNLPMNAGKPWSESESDLLIQKFDEGLSISELVKEHMRTHGAIKSQLVKLGKVEF